jgi:hypothetical protein
MSRGRTLKQEEKRESEREREARGNESPTMADTVAR